MPLAAFALFWALVLGVPLTVWQLIRPGEHRILRTVAALVVTGFVFFVEWLLNALMSSGNTFDFWNAPGFWFPPMLGLLIILVAAGLMDRDEGALQGVSSAVLAAFFVLAFVWPVWLGNVGAWGAAPNRWQGLPTCDPVGTQQMVHLLPVQNASLDTLPNIDLNEIIRVTPELALQKASQLLPHDIGSYVQPDRAYLQLIHGDPYYVIDLKVIDAKAFDEAGDTIPGYVLVNATDTSATDAQFVSGYAMHLAPFDAGLGGVLMTQDLSRWVYWNYTRTQAGYGYEVQDISGMQVDDSGRPYFTGTIMKPVVGHTGFKPVGIIVVDPQTETYKTYPLDRAPDFAYIRYPQSYVEDWASNWWATYNAHNPCHVDTLNELKKDSLSYQVVGKGRAEFVFTYTSVAADTSLLGELVIDPTTGQVTNYPLSGATASRVTSVVNDALAKNPAKPTASHCQIMRVESTEVWYCIVTLNGNTAGFAMLQARHSTDNTKVLVEPDMNLLLSDLQKQIAQDGVTNNPNLTATTRDLTFTGTVTNKASVAVSNGSVTQWIPFTLQGPNIPAGSVFYGPLNDVVALMRVGDTVTVQVHANVLPNGQLQPGVPLYVFHITDNTQPSLGN